MHTRTCTDSTTCKTRQDTRLSTTVRRCSFDALWRLNVLFSVPETIKNRSLHKAYVGTKLLQSFVVVMVNGGKMPK